jgi:Rv2525c-like, glycoside hydrolase-like domain
MTLEGHVYAATGGMKGLDVNRRITADEAVAIAEHSYDFAVRYIRRKTRHSYDLNAKEARGVLAAGLALMVVQHVAPEGWTPSALLGSAYGNTAAAEAKLIGVPPGVTVWCDLEGVSADVSAKSVLDFCNRWHSKVAGAGFVPGLYVGYGAGLDADQLYWSLRFTHYWGAYNVSAIDGPTKRGFQMKQRVTNAADRVAGFDAEFQVDDIQADALGGLPTVLMPEASL